MCCVSLKSHSDQKFEEECDPPQETWSEWKPSVKHSRVFGPIAYVHVPNQERSKLDDRNQKLVLLGYDENLKACKFNPEN